jgi:hypothetical protein
MEVAVVERGLDFGRNIFVCDGDKLWARSKEVDGPMDEEEGASNRWEELLLASISLVIGGMDAIDGIEPAEGVLDDILFGI